MKWLLVSLVVLSPLILYFILLLAVGLKKKWFPGRCPKCNKRSLLDTPGSGKACGPAGGDWWSEYLCKACNAKLTLNRDNQWEDGWRSEAMR